MTAHLAGILTGPSPCFDTPALREEDNPSAMTTTFVKKRIDAEPRVGRPSVVPLSDANSGPSDYLTRTNELLNRVGSSVELEALLSDTPKVDVYGRTIIADRRQMSQEQLARSSSSVLDKNYSSGNLKPSGAHFIRLLIYTSTCIHDNFEL